MRRVFSEEILPGLRERRMNMTDSYVALDLETTGLNPARDRILEIGAVKVIHGEIVDTYRTFVNAKVPISAQVRELTGIDETMIADGKDPDAAVRELIEFCEDKDLLGHNIIFDYSFVKWTAARCRLSFEKKGIDTLKIARKFLPDLESRSLSYLCGYYHIAQECSHRAYDDAAATERLYRELHSRYFELGPEVFEPKQLCCQVKKQGPITNSQKRYLNDLIKYHKIETYMRLESLTKSEASRMIDKIILQYGKIR